MKVILVSMPFSNYYLPSLGISLLQEILKRQDTPCDIGYLQLPYAAQAGQELYKRVSGFYPGLLLGEWLFAQSMFSNLLPNPQEYVDNILGEFFKRFRTTHSQTSPQDFLAQIPRLLALTGPYLETCQRIIPWEQYDVIGFTTTFAQNLASLALARQIKDAWPDKIIVFGGANCEGEMGAELHRQFPFIDYVCSGESDWLFPELIHRLDTGGELLDLQGLIYRQDSRTISNGNHAAPILNLDALPFPNYDDYFTQVEACSLAVKADEVRLVMETSRGCWWGAKSQCTFCGLNGNTLNYRSKSCERVLEEFTYLVGKYPSIKQVTVVDNMLDMRYFKDVIPELVKHNPGVAIFYETKSNLRKEQVEQLKQAGIEAIQPGIESLDSDILRLMGKGCTTIQNIQLLKWAKELGVYPAWNLITGFPGEDPEAYERMREMIPSLVHLHPPDWGGVIPLRLDRYSRYFQNPDAYGIKNIRQTPAYRYVYPLPDESLARLAYYFDFDYADGRDPEIYVQPLDEAIQQWSEQVKSGSLLFLSSAHQLTLYDTRPTARQKEYILKGVAKAIYEFCDVGQTFPTILRHLNSLGEPISSQTNSADLLALLASLVEARLMLHADDRYLSLALPIGGRSLEFIEYFSASLSSPHSGTSNLGQTEAILPAVEV